MTFTKYQVDQLSAKLDAANVKTRQQSGRNLAYIEAWKVIDEANRIFGFDGWTRETVLITKLAEVLREVGKTNPKPGWGVGYMAKVRVTVEGVVREGTGCGSGIDVDLVAAHESAVKEAESDAMKRALMTFGNQFGLALYDKEQANVEHEPQQSEADYVAEAIDWISRQTIAAEINAAWSQNLDRFLSLSPDLQAKMTKARDETLAKLAPPKTEAKSASQAEEEYRLVGEQLKREIDNALDTVSVKEILEGKQFLDLEKHSKKAGDFLRERAKNRIGMIMQGRRAA